jgi:hypothetical protein
VTRGWTALRRSLLMRVQYVRGDAYFLRARAAIAAGRAAEAHRFGRKLEAEGMLWTSALSSMVSAGVARIRGDREGEMANLRAAGDRAEEADMQLHAAVARVRLGELAGSGRDLEVAQRAHGWMMEQEIARPDRIGAMFATPAARSPVPATPTTREME